MRLFMGPIVAAFFLQRRINGLAVGGYMRNGLVFLGLVIGSAGTGHAFAQTAGVVHFVAGEVKVVAPGGGERAARKGVPVNVGDTLETPAGGLAQLKMGDGAIVVVQPQSRLTVAEFHYAGVEDGNEKVRYRLEHGGFRAVTGAIGRTHKKNYLIETPIAHMGVRGTDHESYYFPATGPVSGDGVKPGAFNKVNTGMTFLRTAAGEVDIAPNQVGYVGSAAEVPAILPTVPGFFNRSIAPLQARPAGDSRAEPVQAAEVKQDVKSADGESIVRGRGKPIAVGSGNGELFGFSVKDGGGDPASTKGRTGNGMMLVANGAEFKDVVTNYNNAGVDWGTWKGGSPSVNGAVASRTAAASRPRTCRAGRCITNLLRPNVGAAAATSVSRSARPSANKSNGSRRRLSYGNTLCTSICARTAAASRRTLP